MSSIIRRYIDRMNFASYMAFFDYHVPSCSFGSFFFIIRLEVNTYKTKYMVMSRDQNAGQSHSTKICNNFFARVEALKYLEQIEQINVLCRRKLRAD